jgi:excinuclease UvrABC nuclease subunit
MPINGEKYEFTAKNVNNAPDEHGVYALFDGDTLIYYGRASGDDVTIRSRLQSHYRGDEGPCTQGATRYMRETTSRPIAREAELLAAFERQYGRLPRCNERRA